MTNCNCPALREERRALISEAGRSAPYAMAFVRVQRWEQPLCAGDALASGTAFRSLIKSFTGRRECR